MQLFVCDFEEKGGLVIIKNNIELVSQLRRVLRAKPGYLFYIQTYNCDKRLNVELISYSDKDITAKIVGSVEPPQNNKITGMLIALPNKAEKLELMVQKLTEIGITHIFLRNSERSLMESLNENKLKRINKIVREAVEQSRGWNFPKIQVIKNIKEINDARNFIIFDLPKTTNEYKEKIKGKKPFLGVVGPEGGLTEYDYKFFPKNYLIMSLGNTVLRMETAAIVGGRYLKNRN